MYKITRRVVEAGEAEGGAEAREEAERQDRQKADIPCSGQAERQDRQKKGRNQKADISQKVVRARLIGAHTSEVQKGAADLPVKG